MVAVDVRSLLKRVKAERKGLDVDTVEDASADDVAAQTLRDRCDRQVQTVQAKYTVASDLQGLFYIPDFVTEEEQKQILQAVDAAPASRWTTAGERQMQNWGGRPGEAIVREKLPSFLQALVELLVAAKVYPPDKAPQHVLINSYKQGAGIAPHMDGPLYSPCVATITLGGPALMAFHEVMPDGSQGQLAAEVMLQPCCLLVMQKSACKAYMHSIQSQAVDTISSSCANLEAAQLHVGQIVSRAQRRLSLVFVHKLQAAWLC